MKIALAQINTTVGDIKGNAERIHRAALEVWTCDNGQEAFGQISTVRPDLLILDVMLPGLDGYSIQKKVGLGQDDQSNPHLDPDRLGADKNPLQ